MTGTSLPIANKLPCVNSAPQATKQKVISEVKGLFDMAGVSECKYTRPFKQSVVSDDSSSWLLLRIWENLWLTTIKKYENNNRMSHCKQGELSSKSLLLNSLKV